MPKKLILIFGSINVDLAFYVDRPARAAETVLGDCYALGLGGKGANQAVAVARLGARSAFIGRLGGDTFGELALRKLKRLRVATDRITRARGEATGLAVIEIDKGGENRISVMAGANLKAGHLELRRLMALAPDAAALLLQLENPLDTIEAAATIARRTGVRVILDPAPAPPDSFAAALIAAADVITPNEIEAEALTGARPRDPREAIAAARRLVAMGARSAVIKLGRQGAAFSGPDGEGHVPAFRVKAVDSVAAGDCFNAGLAIALAAGESFQAAVRYGAACGALATTRYGAAESAPRKSEVAKLLRQRGAGRPIIKDKWDAGVIG